MSSVVVLAELALRALVLGGVGVFAAALVRRHGAEAQHAVWRIVLAGMLVLPILMAILPPIPILPVRLTTVTSNPALKMQRPLPGTVPLATHSFPGLPSTSGSSTAPQNSSADWAGWVLPIYALIAALMLSRTVAAVHRARKATAAATRISPLLAVEFGYPRPELRESPDATVPFTAGFREPIIVLPQGWRQWDDFKFRSVLAHEIAHVRRGDWATALAASVNRAVFWYHPLSWWLERRLSALAEEACDAAAIRSTGDRNRYAKVVLDFARAASPRQFLMSTSMAVTSRAGRRIGRIVDGGIHLRPAVSGLAISLLSGAALPVLYAAAAFQLNTPVTTPAQAGISRSPAISRQNAQQALFAEGWRTKPEDAVKLEAQLATDPENLAVRDRLISYYTQQMIPEPRTVHLLWLIEHHPEADIFQLGSVLTSASQDWTGLNTPENSERARFLWLRQVERFPVSSRVLSNAAAALIAADSGISLELVRRVRALEPDDPQWVDWLGVVYARAVRNSFAGGRENVRSFASPSKNPNTRPAFWLTLPESNALKTELETSTDAALVGTTGESLVHETSFLLRSRNEPEMPALLRNRRNDPELTASGEFGRQLLVRARQLDPGNPRWRE